MGLLDYMEWKDAGTAIATVHKEEPPDGRRLLLEVLEVGKVCQTRVAQICFTTFRSSRWWERWLNQLETNLQAPPASSNCCRSRKQFQGLDDLL